MEKMSGGQCNLLVKELGLVQFELVHLLDRYPSAYHSSKFQFSPL